MFSLPDLQASVYNLKTVSRQSSIQSTYMQQLPSLFWHLLTIPHTFTFMSSENNVKTKLEHTETGPFGGFCRTHKFLVHEKDLKQSRSVKPRFYYLIFSPIWSHPALSINFA